MSSKKSLNMMQQELDNYINQFEIGYFSPLSQVARLSEELGELAREVNHHYGEKEKKLTESPKTVAEELGDVLISTLIMANSLEIDLEKVFESNMTKFRTRDNYRFNRKDGKIND